MRLEKTTYNVEVTEEEAELIHRALNETVKELREAYDKGGGVQTKRQLDSAREVRNGFASLCGVSYMGADA